MARTAVTKRVRFEVLRRDGFRCRYCGLQAEDTGVGLTVDHVVPVALSGTNDPSNLVAACRDCNSGKTSTSPSEHTVADVTEDAVRWAQAMKLAAQEALQRRSSIDAVVNDFDELWSAWTVDGEQLERPGDWDQSVEQWLAAGLPPSEILRFIGVAMTSRVGKHKVWNYFCGCCWNAIRDLQARAVEVVAAPPADEATEHEPSVAAAIWEAGEKLFLAGVTKSQIEDACGRLEVTWGETLADELVTGWEYEASVQQRRRGE